MVRSGTPDGARSQQSLGDLVALAVKDLSQLVHYEISLAKSELRVDVRRAAIAGALFGFVAFVGCLLLILLLFAYAYGLNAAGAPGGMWGAFLLVALTCAVLALFAGGAGWIFSKRISRMRRTKKTVADDIGMLRRGKDSTDATADGAAPAGAGPAPQAVVGTAGSAAQAVAGKEEPGIAGARPGTPGTPAGIPAR